MKTYEAGLVVRRALDRARKAGMSLTERNEHAVNALRQVDPDMTPEQAIQAVRRVSQALKDEESAQTAETPKRRTPGRR
jgi:hypothetical protein